MRESHKGNKRNLWELMKRLRSQIVGDKHPKSSACLEDLQTALQEEFNMSFRFKRQSDSHKALRNKLCYLRKKVTNLEAEVDTYKKTKTSKYRVAKEWILRVFLAAPHASGRALAESFHLVAGFDSTTVSRPTIGVIKAAWVEMYINMVTSEARGVVEACVRSAERLKRPFVAVTLAHIQDEADIRLRSGDARDGPSMPRRGRASKVQLHVVRLGVAHYRREIPTELEALGDKTAGTIATSLEGVMRGVLKDVLPTITCRGVEIWAIHLLIGDAIPTNDAAARVIWASVQQRSLGQGVRYFEAVSKCMVHQVGLSAKNGVIGLAASAAGDNCEEVTTVASRLFKYLINDYYEEFCTNVHDWVSTTLAVVKPADAYSLSRGQDVNSLRELYTKRVIPDKMVYLWNNGVDTLSHVDADPASRPGLVKEFSTFMVKFLLTPDEHPTLTRFFTFRIIIDAMLTMSLIGMPLQVFKLLKIKPHEANQKRLKKVQAFFSLPGSKQLLRRASLVLQLTGGLEELTASKAEEGKPPPIVQFANGACHHLVSDRLQGLFSTMAKDPLLEIGPAITVLLGTAADLVLRCDKLLEYPFILCRMCQKWYPYSYLQSIMTFLHEDSAILDVGVSLQLRGIARKERNESQALQWMVSLPVQEFLEQFCTELLTHSLDVERKAAHVKQWESSKVIHIATASLNNICVRAAKVRQQHALLIEGAMKRLRRLRKTSSGSLAWKDDDVRPHGLRFQAGHTFNRLGSEQAHATPLGSGQAHANPLGSGQAHANPFGSGQAHATPFGSGQGSQKRKIMDDACAEKDELLRVAQEKVDMLQSTCTLPVTRFQWSTWLDDNIDEFRERMKTASVERRKRNIRIRAWPDLPAGVPRLQPRKAIAPLQAWAVNLAGRVGWHGVQATTGEKRMFFLVRHDRHTFVIDLEPNRDGMELAYLFDKTFDLKGQLGPLSSLEATCPNAKQIVRFEVSAEPYGNGFRVTPRRGSSITAPLPRKKRGADVVQGEDGQGDVVDTDALDDDVCGAGEDIGEGDDVSSECVVDTDVDSAESSCNNGSSSDDDGDDKSVRLPIIADPPYMIIEDAKAKAQRDFLGRRQVVWENTYFYIPKPVSTHTGLRIHMRHSTAVLMKAESGTDKHLTPSHFEESIENPLRTTLLLRAWMLWRVRQSAWATEKEGCKRHFDEERHALKRDILKQFGCVKGAAVSLGHARADTLLNLWVCNLASSG